jgi:hypothetical protein
VVMAPAPQPAHDPLPRIIPKSLAFYFSSEWRSRKQAPVISALVPIVKAALLLHIRAVLGRFSPSHRPI